MNYMPKMDRRSFLVGSSAAGLSLGFHVPFAQAQAPAQALAPEINAWVVVKPDDAIVIRISRAEMGQGSQTGLAQLVAEELEADWSKVSVEHVTAGQSLARKRIYQNMNSTGSRAIRESHQYVREGGAAARMMLIQAAANEWKVPAEEVTAAKSMLTHAKSGRSMSYGKIADAAGKIEPPKEIKLKDPKDWKIAGTSPKRLDTPPKVVGKQVYGIDMKMPGMVNAAIKACPVFGGKVASFDAAKSTGMPGVKKVMKVGDNAVAVVADTWWRAKTALEATPIVWDEGDNAKASSAEFAKVLKAGLDAEQAFVQNQAGDAKGAIASAAKKVERTYSVPHQNHATMEPMNATALYSADKCEVWCPSQNAEASLASVIETSGLPAAKCEHYNMINGGGFGRRGQTDFVRQAVLIAKEMPGTPVKLIWSREEDMTHGYYHPVTQCKMSAGLDASGKLVGLHMRISGQSILASLRPEAMINGRDPATFQGLNKDGPEGHFGYEIPNLLIDHAMRNWHVPPGFWRGVNLNQNAIYLESFMDELAHEVGKDPLTFRREMMAKYPKHLAVLNGVAERIGWGTPVPQGVGRGIAQIMGFGSYVAAAAEVSVGPKGELRIHRIVAATDPGYVVHPEQVARQVEGSFVYGLSAALYQEITIKDGRVEQDNFDTYDCMRMAQMPKVEAKEMPSGGFWGGVGEPTIAVAAPAVLNAIFALTGKRIRDLPLKDADLRKA